MDNSEAIKTLRQNMSELNKDIKNLREIVDSKTKELERKQRQLAGMLEYEKYLAGSIGEAPQTLNVEAHPVIRHNPQSILRSLLESISGDFTLNDLYERAEASGHNLTRSQIYGTFQQIKDSLETVVTGAGRRAGVYRKRSDSI